jgi:nucleoside-diphosphate-sugar epimerase
MKIFLTGGTGFIGTHFLRSSHASGHEIIALRRAGSSPCLPLLKEPHWMSQSLDEVNSQDLSGCDVLVHLASPGVSPKKANWEDLFYWNVTATLRLVDQARLAGVRRIVVAGTFAEYGRSADRFDPIPIDAPLEPTYGYAASKASSFVALSAYAIEFGLELAYLRVFSAYGEGQFDANFWPALCKAALSGQDFPMTPGEQVRDYLPVEDVASMFWKAATTAEIIKGVPLIRNVGSGKPISMRTFAEEWWSRLGATGRLLPGALPYRSNEVMRFVPKVEVLPER